MQFRRDFVPSNISCVGINDTFTEMCLADISRLFKYDSSCGVLNVVNEEFAFCQSFEIGMNMLVMIMLLGKICAISFDNQTENKLVFWQHAVFLLYALTFMIEVSMLFFVNPNEIYRRYIEPLNENPPIDTT